MQNQNNFYTQQQFPNSSNSNQQQEEDIPINYTSEEYGATIHHFTSQALNGPCSSILNSTRRNIWLSEEGMPQSFIVDISNIRDRPKFFKCIGFDAWHDYSSNPKILEVSVSVDENNFITWITLNAELKEGIQLFSIDPLGRRYNFIKIEIKETYGASKTYLNQLILLEENPYQKLNKQSMISQHSSDQNFRQIIHQQQNQQSLSDNNMEVNQYPQTFISNQESPTYPQTQPPKLHNNQSINNNNLIIEHFPSAQESPRQIRNSSSDSKNNKIQLQQQSQQIFSKRNASDPLQSNQKNYNYPRQFDQKPQYNQQQQQYQQQHQQQMFNNQDDIYQQDQDIQQQQQYFQKNGNYQIEDPIFSQEKMQSKQKKSMQILNSQFSQEKPYPKQLFPKNQQKQYNNQNLQQQQFQQQGNSMQFTNRFFDQSITSNNFNNNTNNNLQQSKSNLQNMLQTQNQQYSDLKSLQNTPQYTQQNQIYQQQQQQYNNQQNQQQKQFQQYPGDNNSSLPISDQQKTQIQLLQQLEESLRINNYKDELKKQYENELLILKNEMIKQQEKIQQQLQNEIQNLKQSVTLTEQQQYQTNQNVKTLETVMEKMQENVCIVIDKIKDLQDGVLSVKEDFQRSKSPFQSPQSNSNQFNSTAPCQTLNQTIQQQQQQLQSQKQQQNHHQTISFNNTHTNQQQQQNNNILNQNQYELFPQSKKSSIENFQNNYQSVGNTFHTDQSPQQRLNPDQIQYKIESAIDQKLLKFETIIQQTMSQCINDMESKIQKKINTEVSQNQNSTRRTGKSNIDVKEKQQIIKDIDNLITDKKIINQDKQQKKLNKKKSQKNVTNTKVLGLLNILQKKLEERQLKIEQLNSEDKKNKRLQKKLQEELGYIESSSSYVQ